MKLEKKIKKGQKKTEATRLLHDHVCRYTTSSDGSHFFVYLTKMVFFFSIEGNKDFIGVAI